MFFLSKFFFPNHYPKALFSFLLKFSCIAFISLPASILFANPPIDSQTATQVELPPTPPPLGPPGTGKNPTNPIPPSWCQGPDTDGDGFPDPCDNCKLVPNPLQERTFLSSIGDACIPGLEGGACQASASTVPVTHISYAPVLTFGLLLLAWRFGKKVFQF